MTGSPEGRNGATRRIHRSPGSLLTWSCLSLRNGLVPVLLRFNGG